MITTNRNWSIQMMPKSSRNYSIPLLHKCVTRELEIRTPPLKGGVEIEQFFTSVWDSEFQGASLFCWCGPYFCSCGAYFFISFRLTRAPKPNFSLAFGALEVSVWRLFLNFRGCLFFTLRSDSEITQKWHVALIKGGFLFITRWYHDCI